ncbi:MAG TPA: DUF6580 family putative transport protein [Candidatus Angelobacter sp.]|nr:DUF6580 family putative transport protein [Candidatus Angelobacter sp.]
MLAYVFILLAVAARVLSGTGYFSMMGFAPLGASLLFFGSHQSRKRAWIPVALFVACDLYLTIFKYHMRLPWDQALIWAWYAGACLLGSLLKGRIKPHYVGGAALALAVSFYLVSNFGVWASGYVGYPRNFAGLIAAYVAAIPFFEKGLASDLVFSAAFFSVPVLIARTRQALADEAHKAA